MKKTKIFVALVAMLLATTAFAQERGYYDAPYTRYEADAGSGGETFSSTDQSNVAFEGSERKVVYVPNGQSVTWTNVVAFRGIVVRATGASSRTGFSGQNVSAKIFINNAEAGSLTFESNKGWKDLRNTWEGDGNWGGKNNPNPHMRYDEQRYLHNTSVPAGATIRIESQGNLYLDFIEIEDVQEIPQPAGYARYNGNGSDLNTFIRNNQNVYIPAGTYTVGGKLEFGGNDNPGAKNIQGAGMWFTTINFTNGNDEGGGVLSYNRGSVLKDVALTRTTGYMRVNSYKGINGVWSRIENVWVERFECGAWFGNYNPGWGDPNVDGMVVTNCRFRNNYADGMNLCMGTRNSTVSHSSFRNNGDDDMAIWPANTFERGASSGNTYEYCTAEHNWMASSAAIFGGSDNVIRNIKVVDGWEAGIRSNTDFPGYGFGSGNLMANIDVIRCGSQQGAFGWGISAIDLQGGTNVRLECVNVTNSLGYDWSTKPGGVTWCGIKGTQGGTPASDGSCNCAVLVPTSVTIVGSRTPMAINEKFTFTAKVNPEGVNQAVTWKSSDITVATVNAATGEVTALKAGTTTITATSTADTSLSATVNVSVQEVKVTAINFNDQTVSMNNTTLAFSVTPDNANNKTVLVELVSGGENLQIVNAATGEVRGLAEGTAVVKITAQDGSGVSKQATITVTNCNPTVNGKDLVIDNITWTPANPGPNDPITFTATVRNNGNQPLVIGKDQTDAFGVLFRITNNEGTVCDLPWSVTADNFIWGDSPKEAATATTVPPCGTILVTAVGSPVGAATWTAGAEGTWYVCAQADDQGQVAEANEGNNTLTMPIVVSNDAPVDVLVNSITITPSAATVNAGENVTFTANVLPADATNKDVTYAVISGNGTIAGNVLTTTGAGTVQVQATAADASGVKSNIVTITVNAVSTNVPVDGITITPSAATVTVGGTVSFTAVVTPDNATNKNVTYAVVGGDGQGTFNGNVLTATAAGTIRVMATAADGSGTASASVVITVEAAPACTGTFDVIVEDITWSPESPMVGDAITFTAVIKNIGGTPTPALKHGVAFDIVSGIWGEDSEYWLAATWNGDFYESLAACDGTTSLAATGSASGAATWTPTESGVYHVRAWVNNDNSLPGEANTDNNQTFEFINIVPLGVGDVNADGKSIVAYGNTVEVRGVERGEVVTVYNTVGAKLYSARAMNNPELITTLPQGIYIVQIEGTSVVEKVVITD
jgi:uncharacterized protein YjdB